MKKLIYILLGLFCFSSIQAQGLGSKNKVRKLDGLETIGKTGTGTLGIKYSYLYFYTASGYINFTTTTGSGGYGLRDNSGTVQFKNSGGSWDNIAGASPGGGGWTDDGAVVRLTTAADKVHIGATTAEAQLSLGIGGALDDYVTTGTSVHIYRSTGSGSFPFDSGCNLVLQTRPTGIPDETQGHIVFVTGDDDGTPVPIGVRMTISTTGNVGIGTAIPAHLLHLSGGNIAFGDSTTGDHDAWTYIADDGSVTAHKYGYDDGNSQYEWWIGGNQAMYVGATGILYVDDTGSGAAAQVDLFDKYDDIELVRAYVTGEWKKLPKELFVSEKKETIRHNQLRQLIGGALLQLDERLSQLEEKNK